MNGENNYRDDDGTQADSESKEEKLSEATQGMEFETEEEAFKFYNAFAYGVGFSIRRSKREKNKCDGSVKSHRVETRFGCLARMKIVVG
ncbi:unnamed protein product [Prunus armeniaca]